MDNINMNKYKINNMYGVMMVNGERYIPHQLHQLPNKYHEIDPLDIIKMKGYVYINENVFPNGRNIVNCISFNKDLNYVQKR